MDRAWLRNAVQELVAILQEAENRFGRLRPDRAPQQPEHTAKPSLLFPGLGALTEEGLAEVLVPGGTGHARQGLLDLPLGKGELLEQSQEQIVQRCHGASREWRRKRRRGTRVSMRRKKAPAGSPAGAS
jgi:hypothetical protein